ncbi:acetyltransferase [Xanthobacter autotrophicus]|uniref:GNAT family N-acetyltransferase n=1 Tax=Xanthobacter TaxID=279 RepID=UPI0024AAB866|nr:GNAT family N-acetyltransferase [Xanthobacter autotrophicus]MDI4664953.1 acetyltransferase [Xanthobacter autotrophicus]
MVAEEIVCERREGGGVVARSGAATRLCLLPDTAAGGVVLSGVDAMDPATAYSLLLRALETVTATLATPQPLRLRGFGAHTGGHESGHESGHGGGLLAALRARLLVEGLAAEAAEGLDVFPEALWQQGGLWLPQARPVFAQRFALTQGRRHPVRPPKPEGIVYTRFIPWLGARFELRTLDLATDLDRFNRWMNDPRVAEIWDEAGDLDRHRAYLEGLEADPHMLPLMGAVDGASFAYFEVYWAKENRIAPFYDAGDHDRGWHVLVGEDAFRGRAYVATWLPSLMHYIFLDDPRTQRIVGEPRADHHQQLRNLERSGFARVSTFDFPHKRAALVMLLRERFFGDRLWVPDGTLPAPEPRQAIEFAREAPQPRASVLAEA